MVVKTSIATCEQMSSVSGRPKHTLTRIYIKYFIEQLSRICPSQANKVFLMCAAGADIIITYFTPELLSWLNESWRRMDGRMGGWPPTLQTHCWRSYSENNLCVRNPRSNVRFSDDSQLVFLNVLSCRRWGSCTWNCLFLTRSNVYLLNRCLKKEQLITE